MTFLEMITPHGAEDLFWAFIGLGIPLIIFIVRVFFVCKFLDFISGNKKER